MGGIRRFLAVFGVLGMVCPVLMGQAPPEAQAVNPPPPTPAMLMQRNGGSLLKATMAAQTDSNRARLESVSFFAVPEKKPRTLRPHDLVTIIVREESTSSSSGTSDLKRDSELDAKVDEWIDIDDGKITGGGQGDNPAKLKVSGKRNFKGEGTVDRSDSLILRITAEVVDVKPNDTLILQARKHIKTDEEEQSYTLTGVCRVQDVTADNTVLSTQMFDLSLAKMTTGSVKDTAERGLIQKLLDGINPF